MKHLFLPLTILAFVACTNVSKEEPINIDVNLHVKHTVGGISEFDRSKYITIHTHQTEVDWDLDMLSYVIDTLDVYMGRDNETGTRDMRMIKEDPARPGYIDLNHLKEITTKNREWYNENTQYHKFEKKNNSIITTYVHPLYPVDTMSNDAGWTPANFEASAEFIAHYIKEQYGNKDGLHGEPMPKYFEVMNEPMWKLVTTTDLATPAEIFEYHNTVAKKIREVGNDILIGGYCTAFPNYDENDFKRWEERDRLFVDMSGEIMDYYTIHLYDFPVFFGKQQYRRGSNLEATFDMLEHYNMLKFGKVKPIMVSEYGAQMHDLYEPAYDTYREWLFMTAVNSQMMSFMDKPQNILVTLPYIVNTGSYQKHRDPDRKPAPWSILKPNDDGEWKEFTSYIRLYQFWADVKGTRVDSKSEDLDIQVDSYVHGKDAYVIINNFDFEPRSVKLNLISGKDIQNVMVKHFHEADSMAVIDTSYYTDLPEMLELDASATMIIKYSFAGELAINETSDETKYYADKYYQKISANTENTFSLNGVEVGKTGEATLRIGIGRDHGSSLQPEVVFNGSEISVPTDWRGDDQKQRDRFFGVREIPVPYQLLKENNTVSVTFPDNAGHISSVTMRVFNFSTDIKRSFED